MELFQAAASTGWGSAAPDDGLVCRSPDPRPQASSSEALRPARAGEFLEHRSRSFREPRFPRGRGRSRDASPASLGDAGGSLLREVMQLVHVKAVYVAPRCLADLAQGSWAHDFLLGARPRRKWIGRQQCVYANAG